jgi:UDP-N-acetylmuramoyl-tripeptide--D-alanyl-D-alanine ligase
VTAGAGSPRDAWGLRAARLLCPYGLLLVRRYLDCLYILQLERYKPDRYGRWAAEHVGRLVPRREVWIQAATVAAVVALATAGAPWPIAYLAWVAGGILSLRGQRPLQVSQRVQWTARAVRVAVPAALVGLLVASMTGRLAGVLLPWLAGGRGFPVEAATGLAFAGLFAPAIVRLAARIVFPLESLVARRFLAAAALRMRSYPGKVVGITGSYGKTSTKLIAADLLAARYRVQKTGAGVNTTMGITRIIREELRDDAELFVVEMSAYGPGEIREVCDLTRPALGILTAVGVQHLERFGTPEAIAEAKYELIAALPAGAPAVINADDPTCRTLAERARREGKRVLLYGLEERPGLAVQGRILQVGRRGTRFAAAAASGETQEFDTPLLGRWNISNILAGLAVGVELGIPLAAMAPAVAALSPAPRRLEIREEGGITRILDVANANPRGAEMALEVLQQFSGGSRILITPGMVELGSVEAEENFRFGERAAESCDYVVLVGPEQTRPIREGLAARGFPAERLRVARNADEVADLLAAIVKPGDVLLYENRLPDTYLEVGP